MSNITDVTVTITRETVPVSQEGFGLPLIVGDKTEISTISEVQEGKYYVCNSLVEVGELGSGVTNTEVYKMASAIFMQTPSPEKVAVAWIDLSTPAAAAGDLASIIAAGHNDWYFLLSPTKTVEVIDALATFAAGNEKLYFGSVPYETLTDLTTDLTSATTQNERAVIICHKKADTEYPEAAWVGKCAPYLPGSITWKFKTLSGVSVSGYDSATEGAIKNAHANLVVSQGGILHTTEGTTMTGEYIDVIRSQDFVSTRIAENVFRLLASSPKVPYDDRGIGMVLSEVQAVMQNATGQGIIAVDKDGNGMWSVSAPTRSQIPTNDIANRILPDIGFEFTLAGAIHSVRVKGIISI